MTLDKIIVSIVSLIGIVFTYWFFLMKKDKEPVVVATNSIDILVKGGYTPEVISIKKNKTTTLNFNRQDSSSCLEEVVISEFKVRKSLTLNKTTSIEVTPKRSGTFEMSCGMNMFHGKIIVK